MKNILMNKTITTLLMAMAFAASSIGAQAAQPFEGTVNLNTASLAELMQLPGIGEAKGKAILERRNEQPFKQVSELMEVKGIGEKLFAQLRDHVTVSGPSLVESKSPNVSLAPGATGSGGR